MIFTAKTKQSEALNKQAGASLMLAVLILSAITAIAFSLAAIVFIEIRSSGDSARTEPALYATFGVTEEALFQYKRFYTPPDENSFDVATCSGPKVASTCKINGVQLTLPGNQPLAFDNSPRVEFIGAGTTKTVPLYVANDFDQQFVSVTTETFPNQSSSSVLVYFVVTNENGSTSTTSPVSVDPGESYEFDQFTSTGQYELIIENSSQTQDVSVKIDTVRVGFADPDGLPFVGEQVLRIVADYLGLTRTYQVRIPIP